MTSNKKHDALVQVYILLLQLISDYHKNQLILKSIVVTLLAGGSAIILTADTKYILNFHLSYDISIDILSLVISSLLLIVISYFAFMHREFEHYKDINAYLISEIEYQMRRNTDAAAGIIFSIQARGAQISDELNKRKPYRFLNKVDFLGFLFYWLALGLNIIVLFIDILLTSLPL